MASAKETFDAVKMRREIFQARNRDELMTIEFVAETARLLVEKGKQREFENVADRSTKLLQGNLILKTLMLSKLIKKCGVRLRWPNIIKYCLELEKLFGDSTVDISARIQKLLLIGNSYLKTSHYSKAFSCFTKAKQIAEKLKNKSAMVSCIESLGNVYLCQGECKKAIQCFQESLSISHEIGSRSGIASNNGNLGNAYFSLGQYEKAIEYHQKCLTISSEIGSRSGIASTYGNLGNAYSSLGQYEKAIEYYQKGLTISSEIDDRSGIASKYGNLGNAYFSLGQYEKAIEYHQKCLTISSEIGDRSGIASTYGNLGNAYSSLGQYEKAIEYHQKCLTISSEIGDRSVIANSNGNLGSAFRNLGQYEKAIEYYGKNLTISSEIGDRSGIASTYGNLGNAYSSLGQYEKAIEYYQKGLTISSEIGDRSGIASMYGNSGIAYLSLGQYEKAIEYHQKGLTISSEIGDRSGIASNNGSLGNAYLRLGQYEKAIEYYQKCLTISSEIGDRSVIASSNGNLGNAYSSLGQYEKAIEYYQKGLTISSEIGDRSGIASKNGNLGSAFYQLGQYEKAIEYYQKGLTISSEIGDRSGIASNNGNLGNVYRQLGDYKKAIEASKRGLIESIEIGDPCFKLRCASNVGRSYLLRRQSNVFPGKELNDINQAISYLKISIECGDEIFSRLAVDVNMSSFCDEYFMSYVYLMRCFILFNRIEAALLVIDLGKAKALQAFVEQRYKTKATDVTNYAHSSLRAIDNHEEKNQTCYIVDSLKLKKVPSTVLFYAFDDSMFLNIWVLNDVGEIKHIGLRETRKWTSHETFLFDLLSRLLSNFSVNLTRNSSFFELLSDKNRENHWNGRFRGTLRNNKYDNLMKKAEGLSSEPRASSERLQSCDVITLLSMFRSRNTKDVVQRYDLDVDLENKLRLSVPGTSNEKKGVKCYDLAVELTKARSPRYETDTDRLDKDNLLQILFEQLIQPVIDHVKGTKLIIVPDKFLFFVPFSALKDQSSCPLSKNYNIQITPSLHTLYSSMKQSHNDRVGFALFVGNPKVGKVSFRGKTFELPELPSATIEVQCLAPLFGATPLVECEAVKKRVTNLMGDARLVHIAAHGEEKWGEILLAPHRALNNNDSSLPTEESYLLRQRDIMEVELSARLVVLSCCHTGRGKITSEGVIGITRAFLAAGACSVLATLWPIDDEGTKTFMENFYEEICKETPVCEALKRTMNKFQQHENVDCRNMKIWAPFTIYGEDVKFSKQDIDEIKKKSREMFF